MALMLTACEDSTGPAASDAATIKADLQVMAAKITRLSPVNPNGLSDAGESDEGAFKRSASDCVQEGMTVDIGLDTSVTGIVGTFEDTTYNYTAAGGWSAGMRTKPTTLSEGAIARTPSWSPGCVPASTSPSMACSISISK